METRLDTLHAQGVDRSQLLAASISALGGSADAMTEALRTGEAMATRTIGTTESLLIALDLEGVAVSTGSACSSGSLEPSHVLRAMGLPGGRTRNSLRFSLGPTTTAEEIDFVAGRLPALVTRLRALTRAPLGAR